MRSSANGRIPAISALSEERINTDSALEPSEKHRFAGYKAALNLGQLSKSWMRGCLAGWLDGWMNVFLLLSSAKHGEEKRSEEDWSRAARNLQISHLRLA